MNSQAVEIASAVAGLLTAALAFYVANRIGRSTADEIPYPNVSISDVPERHILATQVAVTRVSARLSESEKWSRTLAGVALLSAALALASALL